MAIAIAAVGLCMALLSLATAQEVRTWTDSTGKYKVKAKFLESADGKVTLEREDGTQLTIPLEKLSEADRKAVAEMQSDDASPFKAARPKPARKKSARRKRVDDEESDETEDSEEVTGEGKVVKPRWRTAKQILPAPSGDKWSLSIEAPQQPTGRTRRAVAIPPKRDFFEGAVGFAINPVCRRAVLGYVSGRPGDRGRERTRIVLCDLQKGTTECTGAVPGKMAPLALSDDGSEVLMRRNEFGFGNQDQLETWSLGESGVTKTLQWTPHDDARGGDRDVKWARYVGEGKLLTAGGGKLTLWDSTAAKPLWWLHIDGGCYPALSADRKYAAFAVDKQIGVLDVGTGEVAAMQPAPKEHLPFPVFAFTPKGTRLACGSMDRIYIWDVATGALYREISLVGFKQLHVDEHMICPSEEHLLLGKQLLLDIESQAKIWTYQGHELVAMLGGVCWFEVRTDKAGALVSTVLPQPSALERIQKATESADFFVLKPGTTVKLNVSALPDPGEREKIGAALAQKLQAGGFQVGPSGTIELAASAETGKRRDVSYHTFGHFFGGKTYSVQEYISRLKFVYQGQAAWEVYVTSVPSSFTLKEGETVEQVLRRSERPNYEWFGKVELPKLVQKPTAGAATIGTSQVTISGVP